MKTVILIDGKNCLYRYQSVFNNLTKQDGFPTGALFGCLSSMLNIAKKFPKAYIVWCWDGRGDTWRHRYMNTFPQVDDHNEKKRKFKGYKGQRHKIGKVKLKKSEWPESPRDRGLLQLPVLELVLRGTGIRSFTVDSLECDDLVGMLTKRILEFKDTEVIIHSGDHDFYQLLSDRVRILTRVKAGKAEWVTEKIVRKKYRVKPKNWAKYRALTGDSSDNIAHLKHIGGKTAVKLLKKGVDPSIHDCPVKDSDIEKYARCFPEGVETVWPALHGNYRLCRLVQDINDSVLPDICHIPLQEIFNGLTSVKKFRRSSKGKTPEAFRRVGQLLTKYELSSILGRRALLFSIP